MKRYVILVSFFYIGNLRSMNEDRVVNVQGFMNDDRGNRDREADVQHLENNDVCEWNTLGDIEK
ncbi:MAG TPA: hypothetical protein VL201_05555, partial [Patescibacteria group bacterium]|nr:hypothetical protein [Patescibacteria group bacterium]